MKKDSEHRIGERGFRHRVHGGNRAVGVEGVDDLGQMMEGGPGMKGGEVKLGVAILPHKAWQVEMHGMGVLGFLFFGKRGKKREGHLLIFIVT